MKTAIVSAQASPLGTEYAMDSDGQNIYIAELSAALARRGHDVTVYTRREHPSRSERVVTDGGYTVVHIDAGPAEPLSEPELFENLGTFGAELAAQWSDRTPDVAHAHFWTSGIATELAAREAHIPTVQTFHELGAVKQRQLGAGRVGPTARVKLERLVARNASWVAAASTDELTELIRMGCSRSHMSVVPCGVDVNAFATEGPCVERGDRPRILAAGVPVSHKGFDTMIIALRGIPDAELVIVGGPEIERLGNHPEVHRLSVLASALGVADRVVFTGAVRHDVMPEMLRSADLVLCTPWYEGFGLVPLEAMACGVPVVATAVGGMPDMIVHDVTGRLVPPRNPRAIAEAASELLNDSFLRRSQGLAGRDRVCARYSWDKIAEEVLRIYARVVAARFDDPSTAPTVLGRPTITDWTWF